MSAMGFRFETSGFHEFAAYLLARAASTPVRVRAGLEESIDKLQEVTQANSSGRPGPNIITGSYHDSWFTAVGDNDAVLSNRQPQALRLEFGFVGVDSLGRSYCVDMQTHALSTSGWRTGDELAVGDLILTINPDTWLAEWQPVTHLWRFEDAEVNVIEGRTASIAATDDHRWLVERYYQRAGEWRRGWYTTADMPSNARIPLAAKNADLPTLLTVEDDVVELIGWFWTEGSYDDKHAIRLSQSAAANPGKTDRIMALLHRLLGQPGRFHDGAAWHWRARPNGVIVFTVDRVGRWLVNKGTEAPTKALRPEFLSQLTQHQLDLLIDVSMMADGHVDAAGVQRLGQHSAKRIAGWEMACVLAGRPIVTRQAGEAWTTTMLRRDFSHAFGSALRKDRDHLTVERRRDAVWCPTTPNGTWLAKRNGTVYFTGNSQPPYAHLGPAVTTFAPEFGAIMLKALR